MSHHVVNLLRSEVVAIQVLILSAAAHRVSNGLSASASPDLISRSRYTLHLVGL